MNPIALMQLMKKIRPPNPDDLGEEEASAQAASLPEIKPIEADPLEEEGPAFRALRDNTAKAPKREDYKPSLGRNIAAALLAGAQGFTGGAEKGIALGQSIKNAPFDNAQGDFQRKQKTLGDLASLEETDAKRRGSLFDRKATQQEKTTAREERSQDRALTREQIAANQALLEDDRKQDNVRADRALTEGREDRHSAQADRKSFHEDAMALGARNAATGEKRAENSVNSQDRRLEMTTKKAYEAEMKPIRDQEESFAKVRDLAKRATGPADVALLMQFVHGIDDTASREGEVRTAQSARSLAARIESYIENLKTGRKLDSVTVQQFVDAAGALKDAYSTPRKKQIQDSYSAIVKDYGYDPKHVMSDYTESSGLSAEQKAKYDADFDKKYGQRK